jgi:hypothetical protein
MKKTTTFFKEHVALLAAIVALLSFIVSLLSLLYTYRVDKEKSRALFSATCYLVPEGKVTIDLNQPWPIVNFEATCAIRNLGHRPAGIVGVRNALVYNGKLSMMTTAPYEGWWETVKNVTVNGSRFQTPVKVEPGSQASVDLMLGIPVGPTATTSDSGNRFVNAIKDCGRQGKVKSQASLCVCLHEHGILWTDYLRNGGSVEAIFNGIAGLFFLSDGSYVFGEAEFRYGWPWRCSDGAEEHLPHYMRDALPSCSA